MIIGQRGDHSNANAEHGQDHRSHHPVQQPRKSGELEGFGWHAHSPLRTSAGVIALGCFVSPTRLVNDCEYTAERALSKGSSEGAMPAGNTKGSKLMYVAGPSSSLCTRPNVTVPTSTFSRSSGQGM